MDEEDNRGRQHDENLRTAALRLGFIPDNFKKLLDDFEYVVFDANDIGSGPVATIHLPERVPYGFHASWGPLA